MNIIILIIICHQNFETPTTVHLALRQYSVLFALLSLHFFSAPFRVNIFDNILYFYFRLTMYRPRLRDGSGHGWERDSIPDDRKSTTPLDARTNESPIVLKPVRPLSTTSVALIL